MLVLALPAGWMVDRFGAARDAGHCARAAGAGLLAILAVRAGLVDGSAGAFLCGIGYAFINPATARAVLMGFPRTRRGTGMGVKQTGVPAGGVIAAHRGRRRSGRLARADARHGRGDGRCRRRVSGTARRAAARGRRSCASPTYVRCCACRVLRCSTRRMLYAVGAGGVLRLPRVVRARRAGCAACAREPVSRGSRMWPRRRAHRVGHDQRPAGSQWPDRLPRRDRTDRDVGVLLLLGVARRSGQRRSSAPWRWSASRWAATRAYQAAAVEAVEPHRAGAAIGYSMLLLASARCSVPRYSASPCKTLGYGGGMDRAALVVLAGRRACTTRARVVARK